MESSFSNVEQRRSRSSDRYLNNRIEGWNRRTNQENIHSQDSSVMLDRRYSPRRLRRTIKKEFQAEAISLLGDDQHAREMYEEFGKISQLEELASIQVVKRGFPFVVFSLAIFFDLFNIAQLSGLLYVVTVIANIGFAIFLFFWFFGRLSTIFKIGSRMGSKYIIKILNRQIRRTIGRKISRRLAAILIVKIVPLIGIFASNAFFVFLVYNDEKKIVQKYILLVETATSLVEKMKKARRNEIVST